MPIQIEHAELESRMERLAESNSVPVSKRRLVLAILDAVTQATERRGVTIGQVIEELKAVRGPRKKRTTKRRSSPPPKTLKLTQPPAT